ncbi:MAG: M24 family metallopeptidase C-terminal domain-containing protein, partial [Rhodospirillaceae bacterium]|nr:M24 family metallopeptidase C-terminal domain-containing protein [Rhodospirillaceae bacterium]
LSVHEGPQRIAKRGDGVALKLGMVLSVEPGYYKKGEYGIRIENLVCVIEGLTPEEAEHQMLAFEPLTLAPIDRALIDVELLSPSEISWLDAYHAGVFERLSSTLSDDVKTWLKVQTAPLQAR